jgi:uncharacterized membrane protein YdbT with pleckstrin-like domain
VYGHVVSPAYYYEVVKFYHWCDMVDEDLLLQVNVLAQQYIFHGLDEVQLALVASKFQREKFESNAIVVNEGDPGEDFFIIFDGEVRVVKSTPTGEVDWGILQASDYFGEEALLFDRPRAATIITRRPTVLLRLGREQFFELLDQFPSIRRNLSATAESRYIAHKENFDWLADDEVIYLITRKHEFFLYTSLILPILIGVISIPIAVFGISGPTPFLHSFGLFLGLFGIVAAILWGLWNWIDWGNDYYIVTNQRVLWLERVVGLYNSRREAPLNTILAVNVVSSQLGRIFGYGNIDVRTFTGSILMRNAAKPNQFLDFVKGYRERAQRKSKESEVQVMENAIRQRLGYHDVDEHIPSPKPEAAPETKQVEPRKEPEARSFREKLNLIFTVRYEQKGVITYRKHWLLLVRKVIFPTIALFVLIGFSFNIFLKSVNQQGVLLGSLLTWMVVLFPVYIGVMLWWIYHYVDWRNDIYQLTPDQILDIEKKPLGKEDKKTAPLDSILSIEHSRNGIIELLLNFGNVIINVGQTKFIFRGVLNPDQVHQDIADYMEIRLRKRQQEEINRERDRMVEWLAAYHRQVDSNEGSGDSQS